MSMSLALQIPRQVLDEIVVQAQSECPNECCGLLSGKVEEGRGCVTVRYPIRNTLVSPTRYESDAREMFEAERDMRRRGIHVLAVYHSHPTSDPLPSKTDRERNYSNAVVNLIISLKGENPVMRGWWLTADDAKEAYWESVE